VRCEASVLVYDKSADHRASIDPGPSVVTSRREQIVAMLYQRSLAGDAYRDDQHAALTESVG
jgi:hypothetical protein